MSLSHSERVNLLEKLVQIPNYWVLGTSAEGQVIYFSNEGGPYALWSLDSRNHARDRLTKAPLQFVTDNVATPKVTSRDIFFARDITNGAEQHQIFTVDTSKKGNDEEKLLADTPPMRLLGLGVHTQKLVAFVGASKDDIAIYFAGDGSYEKIGKLPGLASLSDSNERYVVGSGILRGNPRSEEIFILEVATNEVKIFTPKERSVNKAPKLKSTRIIFESNFEGKNQLYVYGIDTGKISPPSLSSTDSVSFSPTENIHYGWDEHSDVKVWSVGKKNGEVKTFVDGTLLPTPEGFIWGITFVGDNAYYSHCTLSQPARILRSNLKGVEVVVDNPLPPEISRRFGQVRFVKYKSSDNLEVPAFLVESSAAKKPGPSVVYVHGGPTSEVANAWSVLPASLVVFGYHVVAPNYRGSTGYGEEYKLSNIGDLGGGDLNDIAHAALWAKQSGIAGEVAVVGYSYGGFSTLMSLAKYAELWNCGVAGAAIADWEEQYEISDSAYKHLIDDLFDHRKELLKERSPISYVEKVKAPLCIIHSQNDSRTPLRPILRYAMKLPAGVSLEMHIKPDLGHAISTTDDIMNIVEPAASFLDKHLKRV